MSGARPPSFDIACQLLARGLSVFPVPRPRPDAEPGTPGDGKVPALPWGAYQLRLPTVTELEAWAWFGHHPKNIAVITGAISGVVVVDADGPGAFHWCHQHLPYTPWLTKTAKGYHLWYRHPGRRVANRARIATNDGKLPLDVRGDGGYVIAPGSLHASGATYDFAGDWSQPRETVPVFWPGWLERTARPASESANALAAAIHPRRPGHSADALTRARMYLAAIPRPDIGAGSDQAVFYAACRLVRRFELAAADAVDLLWEWAGQRPGWDREWITRKVAHAERYGSEPRGA